MANHELHHVTLERQHDYQFAVRFDDVGGTPSIVCDEPAPLGEGSGPNPADLLAAAVGGCLAASLTFCLRRARIEPEKLVVHVTTRATRNSQGRLRISGIDVELTPTIGGSETSGLQRCHELFEDFCTVTASIRHGIPVSVSLGNSMESAA